MTAGARRIRADRGDAGKRLDLVLRRHLPDVAGATRARIQQWIRSGNVSLDGETVRRAAARVALGDVLAVELPDWTIRKAAEAEDLALHVLYEDDWLMAVDKPPGMVVHPGYANRERTLMGALLWRARDWPPGQRPSIVGRLDKLTSGVVLVAKTSASHAALQRGLTSPQADKSYLAVVYGRVGARRGRIDFRLRRDPRDRRRVIPSIADGAPSVTEFERLARTDELSLLRCRLLTGRMHQIRVHLAARGWPIVGDPTYGRPGWTTIRSPELAAALRAFPRQALHAWRVTLRHPASGRPLQLSAPVPRDLGNLLIASGLDAGYDTGATTKEIAP